MLTLCNNIPQRLWLKCGPHDDLSCFSRSGVLQHLCQAVPSPSLMRLNSDNGRGQGHTEGFFPSVYMTGTCAAKTQLGAPFSRFVCNSFVVFPAEWLQGSQMLHMSQEKERTEQNRSSSRTYIRAHTASLCHILLGEAFSKVHPGSGGGNIHCTSWWRVSSSHWTGACFDVPISLGNPICHVELHRSPTFVKLTSTIICQGRIIAKFQCLLQVYKFN